VFDTTQPSVIVEDRYIGVIQGIQSHQTPDNGDQDGFQDRGFFQPI